MSAREAGAATPVVQVTEVYDCDECGEEMTVPGREDGFFVALATHPPMYGHVCPNGHRANLYDCYPRTVLRPA